VSNQIYEGAMTARVPGLGRKNAPFLIVQGHPSKEEDVAGKLGSGRYTQILIELLKEAGFKGEDIRITTAVPCCPPNRAPDTEEVNACREFLRDEILNGLPKAVVAVGDTALRSLCSTSGVIGKRGSPLRLSSSFGVSELEVWPVYSPALLLKTPNYRAVIVEDLRRVRNSFLTPERINYEEHETILQIEGTVVAFDLETDYNYETKTGGDNVTQSAYSFRDSQGIIRTRVSSGPDFMEAVRHCRRSGAVLCTHNGWSFDLPKLGQPACGRDTMCLAWLVDETQPKSLEALACKYVSAVPWKSDQTAELGSEEFKHYNARDAYYTLLLHEELCRRLGSRVKIADNIILPAFVALQECSKRGIYISQGKVKELMSRFTEEEGDSIKSLQNFVGDIAPWCRNGKGELAYKKPTLLNPSSPHQISEYFNSQRIITRPTASGKDWSSDAKALETAEGIPEGFREPLETYRHAKKMLTTYLEPLTKLGEDGRIHPEYYMFPRVFAGGGEGGGTASGRLTASDNALTLPREFKSVGLYNAPRGKVLAEADYGALEFRLGAWFAGAKTVLENYAKDPEWDAHTWFARAFYGLGPEAEVKKEMRQVAKSANFSLLFGGYWKTMQSYAAGLGLKLSQKSCEQAYEFFHTLLPEMRPWWESVSARVKEHGYIETPTGRRRNFGEWKNIPYKMRGDVEREAVNMLPQSFGHDLTLLSLANCHAEGLPICHEWHDAIYFEIDEFKNDEQKLNFEALVRGCMIDRPIATLRTEFGVDLTVPLTVEFKYTRLEN
jgi:uracil-DNA glycosylase family 4